MERIHNSALVNHKTSSDSLILYLSEALKYDSLNLSKLSKARFYHLKGHFYEMHMKYDSAALSYSFGASLLNNEHLKTTLLLHTANAALKIQDYKWYNELINEAEILIEKSHNPKQRASLLSTRGDYKIETKNYQKALSLFFIADSISEANNISRTREYYHGRIAYSYEQLSDYSNALKHLEKSIALSTQEKDTFNLIENCLDISRMYAKLKLYEEAVKWQQKHLGLTGKTKNFRQTRKGLENLGIICAEKQEWEQAEAYFLSALEIAYKIGSPLSVSDALTKTACFYYVQGNLDSAYQYYKNSYNYKKTQLNNPKYLISSLYYLGNVELEKGEVKSGINYLKKAAFLSDSLREYDWLIAINTRLLKQQKGNRTYIDYAKTLEDYEKLKERLTNKNSSQYAEKEWFNGKKESGFNLLGYKLESDKNKNNSYNFLFSFLLLLSVILAVSLLKGSRLFFFKPKINEQYSGNDKKQILESLLAESSLKFHTVQTNSTMLKELKELLEKEKIFKNSQISLSFIAKELGTNATYASKLINSEFNCNFHTLIKRYRVEYVKKSIEHGCRKESITKIAFKAGFKSQSSFYSSFKEIMGVTPLQYFKINEIKNNEI